MKQGFSEGDIQLRQAACSQTSVQRQRKLQLQQGFIFTAAVCDTAA
jgi:hypothetical protein